MCIKLTNSLSNIYQRDNYFNNIQEDVYEGFTDVIPKTNDLNDWQTKDSIYFDKAYNKQITNPTPPVNFGHTQMALDNSIRFRPHTYSQFGLFNEGNHTFSGYGQSEHYENQFGFPKNITENVEAVYKASKTRHY
jgi:hypothetical protein